MGDIYTRSPIKQVIFFRPYSNDFIKYCENLLFKSLIIWVGL